MVQCPQGDRLPSGLVGREAVRMTKMRCFVAVVGTITLVGSAATAGTVQKAPL